MYRSRAMVSLLLLLAFLAALPQAAAQEQDALFQAAAAALLSPNAAALQSATYSLRTGDGAYAPYVAPEITPYDEGEPGRRNTGAAFQSSDERVVAVDAQGLMTGVAQGTAVVTCTAGGEAHPCTVTVSDDAMPERVKAFVYVVEREFLFNRLQAMPRANRYTKWYYGSSKEVGWCSVFTIWCANASGTDPIPGDDAADVKDSEALFLREGQVGNQYDGFVRLSRFAGVPRPGYLVIYANLRNSYLYTHIGIVTAVRALNDGLYQVTTVEGNMSGTVKRYTYVYDSNLQNHLLTSETRDELVSNIFMVPEENRSDPLTQYEPQSDTWTVFGFCATWL
ncbi:MAG: CHAP domain-containing protein [Bacillota bacterium]